MTMCVTDMRAPRFVSGPVGTGGVDDIEVHEYSHGVTDSGGEVYLQGPMKA